MVEGRRARGVEWQHINAQIEAMSVPPHTVTIECDSGNEYDGRLGVRISSIFVIGLGSMLGMSEPAMLGTTFRVPQLI